MTTIREKLHQFIDRLGDEKAQAIYTLFENEINAGSTRAKIIQAEREKYLKGEGKSFNWEEVKRMAVEKELRNEI